MATSESESESESLGYDTDDDEEAAELDSHESKRVSGKRPRSRIRNKHDDRRSINPGADSAGSSSQGHRQRLNRQSWISTSSESETDLDPGQELTAEDLKTEIRCIKYHNHRATTSGETKYQGTKSSSIGIAKQQLNDLVSLSSSTSSHGRATEIKSKRMQEGAVIFRPTKKPHHHRHKRSGHKMKPLNQENMGSYKKAHQHLTSNDISLLTRRKSLSMNGGLIPVDMNFNIRALIHPSLIGRDDGIPVKRRKKMSLSSDSEAISNNEINYEPVLVNERRTTSSPQFEKIFTISDSSPDDDERDVRTKSSPRRRSSDSDVICLGSDSDHRKESFHQSLHHASYTSNADAEIDRDETFFCEPPNLIQAEPLSNSSRHYTPRDDDDNKGADSDSSDLPEFTSSYNEQLLCGNDVERSPLQVHDVERSPPQEHVWPSSPPDSTPPGSDRSRHSSADLGERVEQPTDACWVSFLSPSGDTKASDLSVRNFQHSQCISKPFSQDKRNTVYACHEEEFTQAAVNLIAQFTTTNHKPPPQLLQDLFHDTLRKCSSSSLEASVVYRCLKNIQHLHHPSSRDFPMEWNLIKSVATTLVSSPSKDSLDNSASPAIKWHIDLLSLHFLVSVLEDDVERKARWKTLKKSFAFSILNPEICRNNCREVVDWIHKVVSELEPLQGFEASTSCSTVVSCGCPDSACHRNYVLPLLGKLLELSFRMATSLTLKTYVQRTVDELNSCGLKGLPQLRLVFETLQQPWLRLKLSDLIFNTHFESKIFSLSRDNISISRIVQEYFLFLPRPTSVNTNDEEEEDEVIETGFSRGGKEEMAYLLLVMLQSYLRCCSGYLSKVEQGKKSISLSKSSSPWSSVCRKQLSQDDRICLLQMGDYVDQLRNHLSSSSHPSEMSMVTEVCLAQMSVLYEWM
ncbi:uncharacterized protein LOC100888634 isoform X1 [Strongylocentrotus purpuratus]|uniref:Uncharacterized protein n=1 Tax=Strongylocentrotus purpuratus TaxID=7668 RepID=A0A7M7HDV3_STRPU|nr:uncharacterized protein LOC100888634 isoform X1 [Strongylocentrotus purpuratus]